ncbi:MAG TPA: Npt1/Npt2 family nucleotide transporter, partial [Polyangiaceae bacterium]|nr:Npt1/Npt2 family nucleotide transporter [Polyangiaceae bacterium]
MPESASRSPLRALLDIRGPEAPVAALMAGYFFLVTTTFWVLKPLKKSLFIQYYDEQGVDLFGWQLGAAQGELVGKVLNMFVAAFAMIAFTTLSRRFSRERLTFVFSGFFLCCFAVYAFFVAHPSSVTVWTFYLFGDLYSTVMVAAFFAFLNDAVAPSAARRLYGVIVLGGVAGGAFGSSMLRNWIEEISRSGWMWICLGMGAGIVLFAAAAGRLVHRLEREEERVEKPTADAPVPKDGNPALEGARLVFRSRYLLALVAIVGLYEIISTTLDFQFTATVAHILNGPAIGKHISTVFMITNIASLCVQLFLTSFVMTRFPLWVALALTPAAMLGSSGLYFLLPVLLPASLLTISDNALSYSVNQSAREALYTPTSRDEKYKAKAFIDMFVQRFAKALAVGVSLLLTTLFASFESIRWLSLFAVALTVLWLLAARYAGRRFHELTKDSDAASETAP